METQPQQQPRAGGIALIFTERMRQLSRRFFDAKHDDEHAAGELVQAAAAYLGFAPWPWDVASFKPGDRVRNLAKAGALIAAEIERLQRFDTSGSKCPTQPASNAP